jgi:hypothetical protein
MESVTTEPDAVRRYFVVVRMTGNIVGSADEVPSWATKGKMMTRDEAFKEAIKRHRYLVNKNDLVIQIVDMQTRRILRIDHIQDGVYLIAIQGGCF